MNEIDRLAVAQLAQAAAFNPQSRTVLVGAVVLGMTAAVVGVFLLLRRKSLLGDVVGHAALPGLALAFLIAEARAPGTGRNLGGLLVGAGLAGLAGALSVSLIRRATRVQTDAALAVVLSVFYGAGAVLLSIIQRLPTGSAGGLERFLSGRTAVMVSGDLPWFLGAGAVVLVVSVLLFKELSLLCFDEGYAASQGWPVGMLDGVLTLLAVGVTVIGMQTVGLLLITAVLVIPASAARFWTSDLRIMTVFAALLGGGAAAAGVVLSASAPRLAAGPMIVLAAGGAFLLSLLFGRNGGLIRQAWRRRRQRASAERVHVLRAVYEQLEEAGSGAEISEAAAVSVAELVESRPWSRERIERLLLRATRDGMLARQGPDAFRLTAPGLAEARRTVRNHRLWELYLLRHADAAMVGVDHSADLIEHVLDPQLVAELEAALDACRDELPASPHPMAAAPR